MRLATYSTNRIIIPFNYIIGIEKDKMLDFEITNPRSDFAISLQYGDRINFVDGDGIPHMIRKRKNDSSASHFAIIGNLMIIDFEELYVSDEKIDIKAVI